MTQKQIAQGAEAIILRDNNKVIKDRISKGYRIPELDEKLRKSRTKSEAKIIEKAGKIISSPKIMKVEKFKIEMEFIDGDKLSETLNSYPEKKQFEIMQMLGQEVSKLHENHIIHGDLTTSNTILKENKIFIIDFGLGYISQRIEDKAVDLHLIKQALEAKHYQNWEKLFSAFVKGYTNKEILERLKKVESRGRYKH
ncbi:MAG: KEOPS complex kinase/ATPase Bud32 [Nanoarchaeota archaeon]|nr:KEOPS complex kinase/ATPase Bud32 [Nanoarchaeota archaeon]